MDDDNKKSWLTRPWKPVKLIGWIIIFILSIIFWVMVKKVLSL
jgi:hypothetical protein